MQQHWRCDEHGVDFGVFDEVFERRICLELWSALTPLGPDLVRRIADSDQLDLPFEAAQHLVEARSPVTSGNGHSDSHGCTCLT